MIEIKGKMICIDYAGIRYGLRWQGFKGFSFAKFARVFRGERFHDHHIWNASFLPVWNKGRGKYISLGLWIIAIYRGYY